MNNILCFSPHPDDVEIFMNGTIQKHLKNKDKVTVCLVTNGEQGTILPWLKGQKIAAIRSIEFRNAMSFFPGISIVKLGLPDGGIKGNDGEIKAIKELIISSAPNIIYCPELEKSRSNYRHKDHLMTGKLVSRAVEEFNFNIELRLYHSKTEDLLIDIEPVCNALKEHKSQYKWSANPPFLLYWFPLMKSYRGDALNESFRVKNFPSVS